MLDNEKVGVIMPIMILETLKKEIEKSGKTRYRIAKESGVSESQLCKLFGGQSLYCETADLLCKYFGLELLPKKAQSKRVKR
jgi:plasmid maintenance system antidote protein VapI